MEKEDKEENESELKNSGTDQSAGLTPRREGAKGQGAEGEFCRKTGNSRKAGRKPV
ncbi:MAG: hypothetical protein PHT84_07065 [Candidatus Pacebacteria bacterium]|jgi:hypothetical protein|nr:hypothetical protein [Candidatus Paceibacterota bacterium]